MKKVIGRFLVLVLCCSPLFAMQRELNSGEIDTILQALTAQPRDAWITTGTLTAEHTTYKPAQITDEAQLQQLIDEDIADYQNSAHKPEIDPTMQKMRIEATPFNVRYEYANEYTMKTMETVHCNNGRFRWTQELLMREDSVRPPLDKTFMYEYFDPQTNVRKTTAWDGETYTQYDESMEYVLVTKSPGAAPMMYGPLKAGMVPWGYGIYTLEQLNEAAITATQTDENGATQIDMQIVYPSGLRLDVTLEADKAYAVSEHLVTLPGGGMILQTYDDFAFVGNGWMPQTITIEKFKGGLTLMSRDEWRYKNITMSTPADEMFTVRPTQGATIDLTVGPVGEKMRYYASYPDKSPREVDSESLLAKRQAVQEATGPANCATVALGYVGEKLGKNWSVGQLATLVDTDGTSSLYAMREFCRQQGLYAAAVKTDLKTLANMTDVQVILHLPYKNHFVVLADVDDIYVRLIDLTNGRFYYRVERSQFHLDWPEGSALLISDSPLSPQTEISYEELITLKGASGYSCTRLVQDFSIIPCESPPPDGGICYGFTYTYHPVLACESAESGSCTTQVVIRKDRMGCDNDLQYPELCSGTGNSTNYYTFGCNN